MPLGDAKPNRRRRLTTNVQGHVMHLHAALGVGTLELYTVGEAKEGWQYVAAGEPFSVSTESYGFSV